MITHLPDFLIPNKFTPYFIYELIDPITLEVRYIGQTKNLKKRADIVHVKVIFGNIFRRINEIFI